MDLKLSTYDNHCKLQFNNVLENLMLSNIVETEMQRQLEKKVGYNKNKL